MLALGKVSNLFLRFPSSKVGKDSGSQAKRHRAQSYDKVDSYHSTALPKEAGGASSNSKVPSTYTDHGLRPAKPLAEEKKGIASTNVDADRSAMQEVSSSAPQTAPPPPPDNDKRPREEKEFIMGNDTTEAGCWYLIDVRWLQDWKAYVHKHAPVPGPIDNSRLVDLQTGQVRPDLRAVDDYRGVNQSIWNYWHQRYGGGPEIKRRELNLYRPPYDDTESHSSGNMREMPLPGATAAAAPPPRAEASACIPNMRERESERKQDAQGEGSAFTAQAGPSRHGFSSVGSSRQQAGPCCDKCDGPHETDKCPHFKKVRDDHPDAWSSYGKVKASTSRPGEGAPTVRNAKVMAQPADGSCLFHSLSYGLRDSSTASTLRRDICGYIVKNPDVKIADTAIKDWIAYDSNNDSVQSYANRMLSGTWGGGIEMAVLTKMKNVNVHVYEKCQEGYRRISTFDAPGAAKTISVVYQGRMHYDAIVVS